MLDAKSAALAERDDAATLARRWLPTGLLRHVQVNDRNRRGPGQGDDRFAPLVGALVELRYAGTVAVEPFEYRPDGPACAARAIGYLRGLVEAHADARTPPFHPRS
jgi:sugar phosphate isomerase/epimerase